MTRLIKKKGTVIFISATVIANSISAFVICKSVPKFIEEKKEVKKTEDQSNYIKSNTVDYKTICTFVDTQESVYEIIESNKNLTNYRNYIYKFVNTLLGNNINIDLTIFKYNLKDLKIIEYEEDEYENLYGNSSAAIYNPIYNEIAIKKCDNIEKYIYHEFGHLLNNTYIEEYNLSYSFYNKSQDYLGKSLHEGFTNLFISEQFECNYSGAYRFEQNYIKILYELLGEQKVKEIFLEGNVNDLINELDSLYSSELGFENIISSMDLNCLYDEAYNKELAKKDNWNNKDKKIEYLDKAYELKKSINRQLVSCEKQNIINKLTTLNENGFDTNDFYLTLEECYRSYKNFCYLYYMNNGSDDLNDLINLFRYDVINNYIKINDVCSEEEFLTILASIEENSFIYSEYYLNDKKLTK